MINSDFIGLAASYVYATSLLIVGEALRRLFGIQKAARKADKLAEWIRSFDIFP